MTGKFVGVQCWQQERIGVVIKTQALSVDRANFLATHVPMRRIAYERAPRDLRSTSEMGFLDELNLYSTTDQHLFAVVTGIPGTGKSHLIRWLKEQYALAHPNDATLLITRANTSLRSTIQQIIDAGIFATLPDSLKRLQGAVDVLSQDTLAEQILNSLQIATRALNHDDVERQIGPLHSRLSLKKIENFLLDIQVRQKLKEPGGPIERVATFLTAGKDENAEIDNQQFFDAQEFAFGTDRLRQIRNSGGYRDVVALCEDLQSRSEIRESLANYLEYALTRFSIAHATQLAAGDLRNMFNELRTQLRQAGKGLALFIEDITATTGIDQGLVEVLITEHTGEANAEYCRLHSVVGITDTWYSKFLPDNVKERVTHRLTLNTRSGRSESDLLQDKSVLSDFAARYLNAMRVAQADLETWAVRGAQIDGLPNACNECPFRESCHHSFGSVEIRDESNDAVVQTIGLYPFNQQSIATLYTYLREGISRTPRSFLDYILGYIMQSHGEKIATGEFPPPPTQLANAVTVPSFSPSPHDRIVEEQGGVDTNRLRTLFLYWGNRSVYRSVYRNGNTEKSQTIGELPADVLRAFRLPLIAGAKSLEPQIATPATPKPAAEQVVEPKGTTSPKEISTEKKPETTPGKEPEPAEPAVSKFTQNINDWANGGRLFGYDRFADWLAELARAFIDWQSHGISATQVKDYITGSRLVIEGQSGNVIQGRLYLQFGRNDRELRHVLQALADLNDSNYTLAPDQYGEHLATLSHWMRTQEPRFVAFVREPTGLPVAPDYLHRILLENCLWLAFLSGELTPTAVANPVDLYQQVIASCAASTETRWAENVQRLRDTYPSEWVRLARQVNTGGAVHRCRTELLQLLNRPQGSSSNVRFLDAATALNILREFSELNWKPAPLPLKPQTNDALWQSAIDIHEALERASSVVWHDAQLQLKTKYEEIQTYLGDATPIEVFDAIRPMLEELRRVKQYRVELDAPFGRDRNSSLNAEHLSKLLSAIKEQLAHSKDRAKISGIAENFAKWRNDIDRYLSYFKLFSDKMDEQSKQFSKELTDLRRKSDAETRYQEVLKQYDDLITMLASLVQLETVQ